MDEEGGEILLQGPDPDCPVPGSGHSLPAHLMDEEGGEILLQGPDPDCPVPGSGDDDAAP